MATPAAGKVRENKNIDKMTGTEATSANDPALVS
jgi:hypothetical protein